MTTKQYISRRAALQGAAAVAGVSALGAFPTFAQTDKRIVLSTWGGDYAKLLTKHISVPLLAPKGWGVVNDEAQVTQRKAKVVAERRLPRGTSDVQALTATDVAEMTEMGVLEKLDTPKIKNSKNIIKTFSIAESPYFSPHIYSGKVVLYNPKLIKNAPTGMDSLSGIPKTRARSALSISSTCTRPWRRRWSAAASPGTSTRRRRRCST